MCVCVCACVWECVPFPKRGFSGALLIQAPGLNWWSFWLKSTCMRGVSNTKDVRDGLVVVHTLRQQRSCWPTVWFKHLRPRRSSIVARRGGSSEQMRNIKSERCYVRLPQIQWWEITTGWRKSRHAHMHMHMHIQPSHMSHLFNLGPESIDFRQRAWMLCISIPVKRRCNITHISACTTLTGDKSEKSREM